MNNEKSDLKRRVYQYALTIIEFSDILDRKDCGVEAISKQLLRSTTSIGANIIEAQAASSKKDFTNYSHHALKSANESKFWLCLLRDSHQANKNSANVLIKETIELANIIASSILTLKGKRKF